MSRPCRLRQLFTQYVQQTRAQNSFSTTISKRMVLVSSDDQLKKSTFEFPLYQSDCHPFSMASEGQTAHGGVIATVVQDATTLHLCANDSRGRQAVTTDMNFSFMGLGKVGRTLEVESSILKVGATLGVAEASVSDSSTGKVIAVGRHTVMFIGDDGSSTKFAQSMQSVFDV
mmetsp:Transcript_79125/g.175429  ORF Transcript_79125/g.175429 Transcript_79125/m.175429 type:complete len:172 (+) Transcript_79125:132-647(+)